MFSTDEYSAGLARGRVNVARERLIAYAEERSIMDAVAFLTDRLARDTGTGARFACCATCSRWHANVRQTAASSSCRRRVGREPGCAWALSAVATGAAGYLLATALHCRTGHCCARSAAFWYTASLRFRAAPRQRGRCSVSAELRYQLSILRH
jgi:hypothetical protein